MTTTRDISAAERSPPPQPRQSRDTATPWRGGEFNVALQQAAERHTPVARQPARAERRDDDRTEDGADLAALFGPAHDFAGSDTPRPTRRRSKASARPARRPKARPIPR
jgi:hypothetical protein